MHDHYITVPKNQVDPSSFFGNPPFEISFVDKDTNKTYVFPFKLQLNGEYRLTKFGEYFDDKKAVIGDQVYIEKVSSINNTLYSIDLIEGGSVFFPGEECTKSCDSFIEGSKMTVLVNKYERNLKARDKCIEHHGAICSICSFDFEERYGQLGEGFIHVHHLTPVSKIGESYEVDPINDLIPVCPNCHAMIHKKKLPYTIQQIKNTMK